MSENDQFLWKLEGLIIALTKVLNLTCEVNEISELSALSLLDSSTFRSTLTTWSRGGGGHLSSRMMGGGAA